MIAVSATTQYTDCTFISIRTCQYAVIGVISAM